MISRLLRTFGLMVLIIYLVTASLSASEPILIGKGVDAKWSPVKEFLSFIRSDSLFVMTGEPASGTICVDVGPILRYEWLSDSCLLIQQRHERREHGGTRLTDRITKTCLDGNQSEVVADSGIVGRDNWRRLSVTKLANGDVGYFDDASGQETFRREGGLSRRQGKQGSTGYWVAPEPAPDGKIWLHYGVDNNKRQVTLSENHYALPQLSPTNDKFFCKSARGDLVVFDTLGNVLSNLGRVDFPSWSPDGKWIAFCEGTYTEFDIVGSDICIARYDGSQRSRLTNTPNAIEVEPVFSPGGMKLIYREYGSGRIVLVETGIE